MTEPVTELVLEAPAGLIRVTATCGGKVTGVTFRNVPAFATHLDVPIEVPHVGTVVVDVAYGGMFYVIADAEALGFRLVPDEGRDITRVTELIKAAAAEQLPVVHPEQPWFAGITIGQLSARPTTPRNSWRNVVTVSTGALDWSPVDLDRRHRPVAVRDRDVRQWPSSTRRAGWAGRGLPPRGDPGHGVHRPAARGDAGGGADGSSRRSPAPAGSPASPRTSWTRTRSRGLHGRRHLVIGARG